MQVIKLGASSVPSENQAQRDVPKRSQDMARFPACPRHFVDRGRETFPRGVTIPKARFAARFSQRLLGNEPLYFTRVCLYFLI